MGESDRDKGTWKSRKTSAHQTHTFRYALCFGASVEKGKIREIKKLGGICAFFLQSHHHL